MRRALPLSLAAAALLVAAASPVGAELSQKGTLRVAFEGEVEPKRLPRVGLAPVSVSLAGEIKTTDGASPPQLRSIALAVNRFGRLDTRGLAICRYEQIQPSTSAEALQACGGSLVGKGSFSASVALPDQSPFPSQGKVYAFNGKRKGHPAILAHIYGTEPLPTSFTLPFQIHRVKGTYRTVFSARLPKIAAEWGYVDGLSLTLSRRWRERGRARSYLSAGCPAPRGFPGATFSFARASFAFEGGERVRSVLRRSCRVGGDRVR